MTKKERDEQRQREARRRMCLHHFMALCVCVENAWMYGLAGGGVWQGTSYLPVKVTASERKFTAAQWDKIAKWRYRLVQDMGGERQWNVGKGGFYTDANAKLEMIKSGTKKAWPDGTHEDYLFMQTYILYCAFHDYAILRDDRRASLRYLVQTLGTLADRFITRDSPLVAPMNEVYWTTRDAWQEYPDWSCGGTVQWGESEQDKWLKQVA